MRDLSNLLWCDLVDDAERIAFLESGRAVETGIIAPVMVPEIIEVFRFRAKVQVQKRMGPPTLADELEQLAENRDLIDCACEEVESTLANLRDDGARVSAKCGLVIHSHFGQASNIIRMYVNEALRISLRRIAHQIRLEAKAGES